MSVRFFRTRTFKLDFLEHASNAMASLYLLLYYTTYFSSMHAALCNFMSLVIMYVSSSMTPKTMDAKAESGKSRLEKMFFLFQIQDRNKTEKTLSLQYEKKTEKTDKNE